MKKIVGLLCFVFVASVPATAGPILAGQVNGIQFCATDNNIGCGFGLILLDLDPTVGSLFLGNNTLGGVTVNASTHTQTIAGAQNSLNSQSLQIINNNGFAVNAEVAVGGINFVGPVEQIQFSGSGTWQDAGGSTINMDWYADPFNLQGGQAPADTPGTLLGSFADLAGGGTDSFATGSVLVPFLAAGQFSMTEHFTMTLVAGGQLTSKGQTMIAPLASVPDGGATIALLGFALTGLGIARKRLG